MRSIDMRWAGQMRAIDDGALEGKALPTFRGEDALNGVRQLMGLSMMLSVIALAVVAIGLLQF